MAFQEPLTARLPTTRTESQAGSSPPPARPVRVLCADERRFGLLAGQRRCLTVRGMKPGGTVPDGFENFSGYGAVDPTTGESVFLELPQLNTTHFHSFRHECAPRDQDTLTIVLLENGSGHTANSLVLPAKGVGLVRPPYRPELHPSERRWRARQEQCAWLLAGPSDALAHHGDRLIRPYANRVIPSRTSYASFVQGVHALCSSRNGISAPFCHIQPPPIVKSA
jgi:hypothetical protein